MEDHPAEKPRPSVWVFLWRYFTGHYMDGEKRDRHHVNASWWTRKHRAHRALWRIGIIIAPIGWLILVKVSPDIRVNLTVILTAIGVPYVFHHGTLTITRAIPKVRTVTVTVRPEMDEVTVIGEDMTDDLDDALDEAMKNVSPISGKGRSSTVRVSRNPARVDNHETGRG